VAGQAAAAQEVGDQVRVVLVGLAAASGGGAHAHRIGQDQLADQRLDQFPEPLVEADAFDRHPRGGIAPEIVGDAVAALGGDILPFKLLALVVQDHGGERGLMQINTNEQAHNRRPFACVA